MKLVLDLPSVVVGALAGILLASGPSAHWLFDYEGVSIPGVVVCVAFLAGTAAWLLLFPPPFFRVVSVTPMPRPSEDQSPALKPMDWLRDHRLSPDGHPAMDQAATTSAFVEQIGAAYDGLKKLPIHAQALAVAFDLHRTCDKRSQEMKESLAEIWSLNPRAEAEAKTAELLAPYLDDRRAVEGIESVMGRHAFVNTALLGLFEEAKKRGRGGVLACAEILWVKKIDRTLWYTLQNAGRHAYFIEGAGSRAHYLVEKTAQRAIDEPQVSGAVEGLEAYLRKHGLVAPAKKEPAPSDKPLDEEPAA